MMIFVTTLLWSILMKHLHCPLRYCDILKDGKASMLVNVSVASDLIRMGSESKVMYFKMLFRLLLPNKFMKFGNFYDSHCLRRN